MLQGFHKTVTIHGITLPLSHPIYQSAATVNTLDELQSLVDQYITCSGVPNPQYASLWGSCSSGVVDKCGGDTIRSKSCQLAVRSSQCLQCFRLKKTLSSRHSKHLRRDKENLKHPEKKPFSARSHEEKYATLKTYSTQLKKLKDYKRVVQKRMAEIRRKGVRLSDDQDDYLSTVMKKKFKDLTPMQQLFWKEQTKAFNCKGPSGMRWHPMMIKLGIHLSHSCGKGYDDLIDTGLVNLPGRTTIREYTHVFEERQGIRHENLDTLMEQTEKKCPIERRYFSIIVDEMTIKENLVFNSKTGELVGFVHLEEIEAEIKRMDEDTPYHNPETATHMLTFMAKSICGGRNLKAVVAAYGTTCVTSDLLCTRAWDVVKHMEFRGLKVMCIVGDGASANRAFFQMCAEPSEKGKCGYKTVNIYSEDLRPLFFMSDVPHLIKTIRNCTCSKVRNLWKNGQDLSWKFLIELYESSKADTLRTACKLTRDHVYPNSFIKMRVCYAVQAMSSTSANALEEKNDPRMNEFIKFMRLVDSATDCLNGSRKMEANIKFKPNRAPYTDPDDPRLTEFLQDEFLHYFKDWEKDVLSRPGKFSCKQRKNMMLSEETLDGLEITIHSFAEMVPWLLRHGVQFINPRNLCQDDLELYFGKQRKRNGNNENPDMNQFLQNDTKIRVAGEICTQLKGNNVKHYRRRTKDIEVDHTPMQRAGRKRPLRQ